MRYSLTSRYRKVLSMVIVLATGPLLAEAPQQGDPSFEPEVSAPTYAAGKGPLVLLDESHHNFHTVDGRYRVFAEVLRRDGYQVRGLPEDFLAKIPKGRVLVIANALAEENLESWELPTPSAFSEEEIQGIEQWVAGGGSLFLIADHMPFPGAAEELAAAFGLHFGNGYARDPALGHGNFIFRKADGSLAEHPVTEGIDSVRSFTGQAFRATAPVIPLMTLGPGTRLDLPLEAGPREGEIPSLPAEGLLQGALLAHGEGRVAVFGEAAMFTAQFVERNGEIHRFGMASSGAEQNAQFLLNVMHWLSGPDRRQKETSP